MLSLINPMALECLSLVTHKKMQYIENKKAHLLKKKSPLHGFLSFTPHSLIYTSPLNSCNLGKLKLQFSETKVTCSATDK